MELSDFSAAVGDFSQMLASAILLPFRRRREGAPGTRRGSFPRAAGRRAPRTTRMRGQLILASGSVPDEVLIELIHLAGGRGARVVLLPAAAQDVVAFGERYRRYLQRFGVAAVQTVDVSTRTRADDAGVAASIAAADLVLLGGGDLELLLAVFVGSPAARAVQAALTRGAVAALFGPAADAAGQWCLPAAPGDALPARAAVASEGEAARAPLRQGLALLPGTLVATAPAAGGRLAEVFAAAMTCGVQAVVLDAHACLMIPPSWRAEVRAGTVLAVGGAESALGPQAEAGRALGTALTRVAPVGWHLDLAAQMVLPPGEAHPTHPPLRATVGSGG
jgi:cyanophycinase